MQDQLGIKSEPLQEDIGEPVYKIDLSGDLNFNNYKDLVAVINEIKEKGVRKIMIDINKLMRIDSTGIGTLINNARKMEKEDSELIIVRCNEQIMTLLKPIKFESLVKMFKDIDEGMEHFKGK